MRRLGYLAILAATTSLASTAVHAQEIEEVIVTAQKRAENLQSVPISVSAVTAAAVASSGIRTTNDLALAVPGLSVTRTTAATNLTIRGIGTQGGSTGQDSVVSVFIDGVYMPSMSGATMALNNIERIEVLKGPQGTLYGRNATGGAVNIITRDPQHTPTMEASIGYGNKETVEGSFYGSAGLSDKIAVDLAAYYRDQNEGFGYNSTIKRDINKTKDFALRSKALIDLTDDTRITLSGDYSKTSGSIAISFRAIPSSTLLDGTNGYNGGFYDSVSEFMPELSTKIWGFGGKLEHSFGDYKFTSISAYRKLEGFQRVEVDATPIKIVDAPLYSQDKQFTQEFQLSYAADKLTWIVGAYYLDSTNAYNPFQIFGLAAAPGQRILIHSFQDTKSIAAFGQATYEIFPDTNLTIGARYTRDKRELNADQNLDFGPPVGLVNLGLIPTAKKTFKKPTWRIALDHTFQEGVMGYASYSRGFKSGVYNLTAPTDPPVAPETLDAFEVGLKTSLFDRRMRLNVAGFYYLYDNIQLFQVKGASTQLFNAAKAKVYGVDVDFEAALTQSLSLSGGAEWLHHRYTKFPAAVLTVPNPLPPFGDIVTSGPASGNRLVNVPDITVNLALNHKVELAGGMLHSNVSYAYNDGFYWAVDNRLKQKAYDLVNAQIRWVAPNERYNIRLFAQNLTKTKYYVAVNQNNTGDIGTPAPGRTYGVSVGVKY